MDDLPDIKISPLEGTPFLKVASFVLLLFLLLALYIGGIIGVIFWIIAIIASIFILSILYGRLSANWRKLHFPLMVRYAFTLGLSRCGSGFDLKMALNYLFHSVFPDIEESKIENLLRGILTHEENNLRDEIIIEMIFKRKHPELGDEKLHNVVSKILDLIKNPPDEATANYLKVRSFIAFLIERKYGTEEKFNYLYEVLTNRAK